MGWRCQTTAEMGVVKVRRIAVILLAACVAGCGSATNLDTTALVMASGKQAAWAGGTVQPAAGADVDATGSIKSADADVTGSIKSADADPTPGPTSIFYHFLGLY